MVFLLVMLLIWVLRFIFGNYTLKLLTEERESTLSNFLKKYGDKKNLKKLEKEGNEQKQGKELKEESDLSEGKISVILEEEKEADSSSSSSDDTIDIEEDERKQLLSEISSLLMQATKPKKKKANPFSFLTSMKSKFGSKNKLPNKDQKTELLNIGSESSKEQPINDANLSVLSSDTNSVLEVTIESEDSN